MYQPENPKLYERKRSIIAKNRLKYFFDPIHGFSNLPIFTNILTVNLCFTTVLERSCGDDIVMM